MRDDLRLFEIDALDSDPRKAEFLELLLKGESLTQAAEVVGIHKSTAHRWKADPEFAAALAGAVYERHAAVLARLRAGAASMVDVLVSIAEDADAPPSARVSAAREVLDRAGVPRLERLEIAATLESLSWSGDDAAELAQLERTVIDVPSD